MAERGVQDYVSLLTRAAARLTPQSDSARLDAELLLAHVLGRSRTYLHTWPERQATQLEVELFTALIDRRAVGEPVAYLTGRQAFHDLDLTVNAATLIPRPETELLVEVALRLGESESKLAVADLGTGSGAVGLAIARARPNWWVMATDRSAKTLEVARHNAQILEIGNVGFRLGRWYEPLKEKSYHLIVSNPPYVRPDDPHLAQGDVAHEPRSALVGQGEDGLGDIRELIRGGPDHLQPAGWLCVEHGYDQGAAVRALFDAGPFDRIETERDLAGIERVTFAQLSTPPR